ncbi:Ulp1 protease family [Forsythia ovata]|uniref:Ulp1 protease family n=1 Tax=Forsythia ovata TaxID=205694 RepID=A0ABD1UYX3_9LAMI
MQKNIRQSCQKGSTVISTTSSKTWSEVGEVYHLYFSVCSRSHWYVVEVDIAKSTIFIYDPNRICSTDDQIRAELKPMTKILMILLKKINIVIDALAIEWITTTSKQSNS